MSKSRILYQARPNLLARLLLLVSSLFAGAVSSAENDPSVVILFGDSITVGYNLEENFTQNLGVGLSTAQFPGSRPLSETDAVLNTASPKHPSIVVNWGFGGSTSSSGNSRISANLAYTINQRPADNYFVLILYGTNDIGSGISSTTTAFNTRQMINKARAQGSNVVPIVANLLPRSDRNVVPYNSKIVAEVNKDGTPLVRLYERFINNPGGYLNLLGREISGLTGNPIYLHPNVAGYAVIAQTWFDEALVNLVPIEFIPPPPPPPVAAIIMLLLSDDTPVVPVP